MADKLDPLICLTPWPECFIPSSRDVLCESCGAHGALSPETEKHIEKLKGESTPHYFCVSCFSRELLARRRDLDESIQLWPRLVDFTQLPMTKTTRDTLKGLLADMKFTACLYGQYPEGKRGIRWFDNRRKWGRKEGFRPFRCMAYNEIVRRISALQSVLEEDLKGR